MALSNRIEPRSLLPERGNSMLRAALAAGLPLLTSVSPAHEEAWRRFAEREFTIVPADLAEIDRWRRAILATRHGGQRETQRT